jgi:NADPH:quinone reductase-like Zn-dependent oxidoreductase
MKAVVYEQYGPPDVLHIADVPEPAPADNEVLIRVRAASVNPVDFHYMRGDVRIMTGLRGPKNRVLGCDIAGQVEAVGTRVTHFRPGDEVFGVKGLGGGGFAEYVCTQEDKVARKPANLSLEEAAAVPIAAVTALQGLRDRGRIRAGQSVAIDGASGGVGTFAIQIAKAFGAEVTAVCSTPKLETARSIGADRVIDYTREDFTRRGERYDLIFGANATHELADYRRSLAPDGILVMAGGPPRPTGIWGAMRPMLVWPLVSLPRRQKVRFFIARINRKELEVLKDLIEADKVRPVIDRRYPLNEVSEAIRYLEQSHARGKVVLTMDAASATRT